ncbi:Cof-type HAD-IIB family hydrolase [Actinocorallia aurea]
MASSQVVLPSPAEIRLVVTDMDGTLLDGEGRVPADLWALLPRLRSHGIVFSPASGRQYATLAHEFSGVDDGMAYIAENGAYVVRDGVELSSVCLAPDVITRAVEATRRLAKDGADVGAVVCGKRAAYIERSDERFLAEVARYYHAYRVVEDATRVEDDAIKVAVFSFGPSEETTYPAIAAACPDQQVVVSSHHWVDVLDPHVDKGVALRSLQAELGVTPDQTMVFGDYLNDLAMLDRATWSFATANAHPDVLARARHLAPANTEQGVIRTLTALLDGR